jgi:hypothetical protein
MKKQLFSLRKMSCDCDVRGHYMCQKMLVILVDKVVDKNRIIGKIEGQGGGEAQEVADPRPDPPPLKKTSWLTRSFNLTRRNLESQSWPKIWNTPKRTESVKVIQIHQKCQFFFLGGYEFTYHLALIGK